MIIGAIFDSLIISQRGRYLTCRRKPFLRYTTDRAVGHSGGNERQLIGNGARCSCNVQSVCKEVFFIVHGFVLYVQEYGTTDF